MLAVIRRGKGNADFSKITDMGYRGRDSDFPSKRRAPVSRNWPNGVIGPKFDDEQRRAIVAYLKTL
jgi:hypothetical protein